jgi:hypothetical protein
VLGLVSVSVEPEETKLYRSKDRLRELLLVISSVGRKTAVERTRLARAISVAALACATSATGETCVAYEQVVLNTVETL